MKTCTRCKVKKDLSEFGRQKSRKDGLSAWCKECKRERDRLYGAAYRAAHPERRAASQEAYNRSKNKVRTNRKWKFGLTEESFLALLEAQNHRCGLCEREFSEGETFVDHDHACCPDRGKKTCGNCIRAILCRACNQGLGLLQDSPDLLRAAADYIERYR